MKKFLTLDNLQARGKRVLTRLDLNLPIQNGEVTDLTRLKRSLPTLQELVAQGAKVIILAHLGRPEGYDPKLSLAPIAKALQKEMPIISVSFCKDHRGPPVKQKSEALQEGNILLVENIRFAPEEEKNDPTFAQEIASWGDVYVNDAFSAAHRAHASTEGIAHLLPAYAGRLMEEELNALDGVLGHPERPLMAIVGGAKVSTKLPLLENLLGKVDFLVIGGAMANTFLRAKELPIGASLYEPELLSTAKTLLAKGCKILLPQDALVATDLGAPHPEVRMISAIRETDKIFDVGPLTAQHILQTAKSCKTLLWNGPLGVFETPPFDQGTNTVAKGIAKLTQEEALLSVAGGGDTVAALTHAEVAKDFTYVSTAGGAFLEWLEGKPLPGVVALQKERS